MASNKRESFLELVAGLFMAVVLRLIQMRNPISHLGYWEDGDFIKPVAEHMKELHAVI